VRRQTEPLPGMDSVVSPQVVVGALQQGRSRMGPETTLVFFIIAHYLRVPGSQVPRSVPWVASSLHRSIAKSAHSLVSSRNRL